MQRTCCCRDYSVGLREVSVGERARRRCCGCRRRRVGRGLGDGLGYSGAATVGETLAAEGRVITVLSLTTVGAPTVVADVRCSECGFEGRARCDAGAGDFRVILEGSAVTGAARTDTCTTCIAAAVASTAEPRIIVHRSACHSSDRRA